MEKQEYLNQLVTDFQNMCCPFGSLDIKAAIEHVIDSKLVEYDFKAPDKVMEIAESFVKETEPKFEDLDICYLVLDIILQEARNEIEEKASFDIQNDSDFYVYSNYMCSAFDYSEKDKEVLNNSLTKAKLALEDFSDTTQYFLTECEMF